MAEIFATAHSSEASTTTSSPKELIDQDDAVFISPYITHHTYPLVCGAHGIPYLINLPCSGHRIKGELYALLTRGLARFLPACYLMLLIDEVLYGNEIWIVEILCLFGWVLLRCSYVGLIWPASKRLAANFVAYD